MIRTSLVRVSASPSTAARRGAALSAAWLVLGVVMGANAHAAAPACAVAGQVPGAVKVDTADIASVPSGLTMLGWNGAQQLQVKQLRVVTGDCQSSVTGFAGAQLFFKGNLASAVGEGGTLQAARAAPRQPSLPQMNEDAHEDEDGHTHSDAGLGVFLTGARVAVKIAPQGTTEYFVGAWKKGVAHTVAVFARNPQGIVSPAAPLMRSQSPVRGLSYTPGPDATSGTLGIAQESPGELRLIDVQWMHQDFTR